MRLFEEIVHSQHSFFKTHRTKNISFRRDTLKRLRTNILKNESQITSALQKDLGKSPFDAYTSEIGIVLNEIRVALKMLRRYTTHTNARTPLFLWPSKSQKIYEALGVCLIISPWNYPFQLTMAPLVGAVAAGNCAIVKPSERSMHTSKVLSDIVSNTFSEEHVSVVLANQTDSAKLLEEPFDKLFFTGSQKVGQIIYQAAAKQMIPATLELGGKNPCIVEQDANLSIAAKRIVWGKFFNAGQTCVAPDYLLVHHSIKRNFTRHLVKATVELFGDAPEISPYFGRLIDETHVKQMVQLLQRQNVIIGGAYSYKNRYMAPTIVDNVDWDNSLMEDEIFGPILPILTYEHLEDALNGIWRLPKSLALYLFTQNKHVQKKVFSECTFGGGCINDTLLHFSSPYLPVGGVGSSGIGRYRNRESFVAFSNQKTILTTPHFPNLKLRYPPFPKWKWKLIKRLMR